LADLLDEPKGSSSSELNERKNMTDRERGRGKERGGGRGREGGTWKYKN
jgi:hypothetical protein